MGKACPMPVVMAKKAIKELGGAGEIEVRVDNEVAVQNLTKLAQSGGYEVKSEKVKDGEFKVNITVGDGEADNVKDYDVTSCIPDGRKKNTVVVISSDCMGNGSDELGASLMKAFVFALTQQDILPDKILLYNSGVKLAVEGSDSLEDLKNLEAEGVTVEACGTCLNFFELTDRLGVGSVTNMYAIVESQLLADNIVRP
ncbi:MAG: sulfurtransferase-like selenium metabolism protein YedF [Eubacterium sp.]|nr:sulfurtransferase-like selenium metabolism protein YedF [Eubacterium sp.]